MLKRAFGEGRPVSIFTLGTMRAVSSPEQMYLILKAAHSIGINHIETAPSYGKAEIYLGTALKQLSKEGINTTEELIITSKLLPGISLEKGKKQICKTLNHLAISKLDNLAIHGLNLPQHLSWALHGAGKDLFKWAKEENLIGQVGFSSHGELPLIKKAINSGHFKFCSLHLHLLNPTRIPLAHLALEAGMGVMAISPADKGGHLHTPSQTLLEDCRPFSPIKLAYRYLLSEGISTLTLGASETNDLSIAKEMLDKGGELSELENNSIKNLPKKRAEKLGNSHCHQCRECLPCPKSVPIPELLHLRNLAIGHDLTTFTKERYNLIGQAGHWWENINASACEQCGDCLPRCPSKLQIPTLLTETHNLLTEKPRRRLWG